MTITVLELIDLLEKFPDDAEVVMPDGKGGHVGVLAALYNDERDAVFLLA